MPLLVTISSSSIAFPNASVYTRLKAGQFSTPTM
jgi:hypothetical protein